ncbi:gag-pol polyprotein [Tanacetum coccineum]
MGPIYHIAEAAIIGYDIIIAADLASIECDIVNSTQYHIDSSTSQEITPTTLAQPTPLRTFWENNLNDSASSITLSGDLRSSVQRLSSTIRISPLLLLASIECDIVNSTQYHIDSSTSREITPTTLAQPTPLRAFWENNLNDSALVRLVWREAAESKPSRRAAESSRVEKQSGPQDSRQTKHSKSGLGLPSIVALVMTIDKSWTTISNRNSDAFLDGLFAFIKHCEPLLHPITRKIRCPCSRCCNRDDNFVTLETLEVHISSHGFDQHYTTWKYHGEPILPLPPPVPHSPEHIDMDAFFEDISANNVPTPPTTQTTGPQPAQTTGPNNEFEELLSRSTQKLYPGCDMTTLEFTTEISHIKALHKITDAGFNKILALLQKACPPSKGYNFPSSYYEIKKTYKKIGTSKENGKMNHPCDGRAWKYFDMMKPEFSGDPRNVRLGLAADETSLMLTMLIPGPKSPAKDIDVYLQPLIKEPQELWKGVWTKDIATGTHIPMKRRFYWGGPSRFPSSEVSSLSGWSGQGYYACPTCNEDTPSLAVKNKIVYVGYRRFLRTQHPLRSKFKEFYGFPEHNPKPRKFTEMDIQLQISKVFKRFPGKHPDIAKKNPKPNRQIELNWKRQIQRHAKGKARLGNFESSKGVVIHVEAKELVSEIKQKALKVSIAEGLCLAKTLTFLFALSYDDVVTRLIVLEENDDGLLKKKPDKFEAFRAICKPTENRLITWKRVFPRGLITSGVSTPGLDGEMYYGQLEEILELTYIGHRKVVLFRCKWFDTINPKNHTTRNRRSYIDPRHYIIFLQKETFTNNQYILATQATQVFYLQDLARQPRSWKVVEHVYHRDVAESDQDVIHGSSSSHVTLSVGLTCLEHTYLSINAQSTEVDVPPVNDDNANANEDNAILLIRR